MASKLPMASSMAAFVVNSCVAALFILKTHHYSCSAISMLLLMQLCAIYLKGTWIPCLFDVAIALRVMADGEH